jgi:hypothetical protein
LSRPTPDFFPCSLLGKPPGPFWVLAIVFCVYPSIAIACGGGGICPLGAFRVRRHARP